MVKTSSVESVVWTYSGQKRAKRIVIFPMLGIVCSLGVPVINCATSIVLFHVFS